MGIISTGCNENPKLFAGGYSEGNAKGLSVFTFNEKDGNLELLTESDAGPNPSYFCFSGENSLIYFLNEVDEFNGKTGGGLTTLKYNSKTGICEKLNELVVPFGGPCYISRSADKDFLFLANYGSASVAVVKLSKAGIPERATDSILYETDSTNVSHPHMIQQDPAGKFVYVTDLGLDRIMIYDLNKNTGKLNQKSNGICNVPKGSGPRHFTFNAEGSKMYLINELGSTMMAFKVDAKGGLELIQTLSTIEKGFEGKSFCADIHMSMDGKFLYGSNRGENTIVIYKIEEDGSLTVAGRSTCGGDWPRNFIIDPSGNFLLVGNQRSDQISVFRINTKTGIPEGPVNNVKMEGVACLKFAP
ncbi:MAG: lactonase family protein [Bacteroidia bacterium]|nr:lactonase family protein [Bacteroidia bacterium]